MLLVAGATGGVGSLAVQLAAKAGATVIAPAPPEDEQYLRGLGVSEIVPRDGDGDVAATVRERFPEGVDALLDLVNYTPGSYDAALKGGAPMASPTGAAGEGPGRTMVMAAPTRDNLERLGALLADARCGSRRLTRSRRPRRRSPRRPGSTRRASSPFASLRPQGRPARRVGRSRHSTRSTRD